MGIGFIWFDIILILTAAVGFFVGKKRGMSGELVEMCQWVCIVAGAGMGYGLVRDQMLNYTDFGRLTCSILSYLICALIVKLIFQGIRKVVGEKLVEGDFFGRGEYILGAIAGVVRFICILFFLVSLLQAKMITSAEREELAKTQEDSFGTINFPTLGQMQHDIEERSFFGRKYIYVYLKDLLIEPSRNRGLPNDTLRKKREEQIENIK